MTGGHARSALIFGVSGQDGAYLARLLLDRGYEVHGTSRSAEPGALRNLSRLGILQRTNVHAVDPADFDGVFRIVQHVGPAEIYNLAAQSSVGLSFENPLGTIGSNIAGTVNILEAMRRIGADCRMFNASSGDCFGDTSAGPADEATPFRPKSPYAVSKAAGHWAVANYREAYGIFASSGFLFNHESPLRPERFVTQKIVRRAVAIAEGSREALALGNVLVTRDWGWAPEYVEAMWRIVNHTTAEDFVIATGEGLLLRDFVRYAFEHLGLDGSRHVTGSEQDFRRSDVTMSIGNPAKAAAVLGWSAQTKGRELVAKLIEAEYRRRRNPDVA